MARMLNQDDITETIIKLVIAQYGIPIIATADTLIIDSQEIVDIIEEILGVETDIDTSGHMTLKEMISIYESVVERLDAMSP